MLFMNGIEFPCRQRLFHSERQRRSCILDPVKHLLWRAPSQMFARVLNAPVRVTWRLSTCSELNKFTGTTLIGQRVPTQEIITCSKSTIETLEKGMKYD